MGIIDELESLIIDGSLNIENRNLTELPESDIWEKVKYLNCSNNRLIKLPKLPSIITLYCTNNNLTMLPKIPLVTNLRCDLNQLTKLPKLASVINLNCDYNKLIILPELPNIEWLSCSNNKIMQLPELQNVRILHCSNNLLTMMPEVPKAIVGTYSGNKFYYDPKYRRKMMLIYKFTLAAIVVRRWRRNAMLQVIACKKDLHNELLYSPDLPFYLRTPEARHWFETVILSKYEVLSMRNS